MLNRLTVSTLLKAVILTTAFCVVVGFSLNAWEAWGRLQITGRISVITDASANMFKAMHSLRTDRSTTNRLLNGAAPLDSEIEKYLRNVRDTEMPAMSNALVLLGKIEFAQQATLVPEFDRLFKALTAQQKEFWEAMAQPTGEHHTTLAKAYMTTTQGLLTTLDKLSGMLAANVNHQDAAIDQLLLIKQIAWLLRNTAGEASLLVSNGLGAGKLSPETRLAYAKHVGGTDVAWTALELTAAGMQLPPALSTAMAANKKAYFEPEYLALRDRLLTALTTGEKPELTANAWTPITVGRLSAAVTVAEAALDAAREHTVTQYSAAMRLAGAAAGTGRSRPCIGIRRDDARHPPRHQAAERRARRHAQGRCRRSRRRYPAMPSARMRSGRSPARWKPSSSRPRKRSGSRRRSASAIPARWRDRRRSKAMSASSRPWCADRSTSWAMLPVKCAPRPTGCRRFRARPTRGSRLPKKRPARLR